MKYIPEEDSVSPELNALLRLKRYEQPDEGFEQRVLQEFHRKQRMNLVEEQGRTGAFAGFRELFEGFQFTKWAYALGGVYSAVAIVAVVVWTQQPNRGGTKLDPISHESKVKLVEPEYKGEEDRKDDFISEDSPE